MKKNSYALTLVLVLAAAMAAAILPAPAGAQAIQYAAKPRIFNVGKLIIDSSTYQGNVPAGLDRQPEDTATYVFYLLNLRSDLKPRGWVLQNPLAPTVVTQAIHDRWVTIDPTVAHALKYAVGAPVTPDMAAYWEVDLANTTMSDLLKYNLLFISSHTPNEVFTPEEQSKLRKLVESGGVVWLDDCWRFRISDAGRFFLPNLQFHGVAIGAANPTSYAIAADPTHPLLTTPYSLTQQEMNNLGDKDVGQYYHTGFVPPGQLTLTTDTTPAAPPGGGQPEPDVLSPVLLNSWSAAITGGPYPYVSAGQYGSGYVVVSSGDIGDAINANCQGTTGYEVPGPDYDKNGGSVCGNNLYGSDIEDLKFAYNVLDWASNFSTYRRGPQHAAYAPQSVTLPLAPQWQYSLPAGEAIEGDPILLRGNVYVGTTAGRVLCFPQNPAAVGLATAQPLWSTAALGAPVSSITEAEVGGSNMSVPLLLVAAGANVYAFNAAYVGASPAPVLWESPVPGTSQIAGAPVFMDGEIFVAAADGEIWEIDPANGQPIRSTSIMPSDPNNPWDALPTTEPVLHFLNPRYGYISGSPAVGYVADKSTNQDDPTLVLCLYETAVELATGNGTPRGDLLQFPIRVTNEQYSVGQGQQYQMTPNGPGPWPGPWLTHPLNYFPVKNPELVNVSLNANGQLTTTPIGSSSGTMRVTIQWPDGTEAPSYYAVTKGAMATDYAGPGNSPTPPNGTWVFYNPEGNISPVPASTNNSLILNAAPGARIRYKQFVLAPEQLKPDPVTGVYSYQALTPDCVVHVDYDVDLGDPIPANNSVGPSVHPELGIFSIPPPTNTAGGSTVTLSGSAALGPPSIGIDDSIYFGTEDGVLYSVSHFGALGLATNWKYFANSLTWLSSDGKALNPISLADSSGAYRTDILAVPGNLVIRSTPTVGNGSVYFSITDTQTRLSRLIALNDYEFQEQAAPPTANGGIPSGGVPIKFTLAPDPNGIRNLQQPVASLAQFDPLTGKFVSLYPGVNDFSVDPASQTVTILNFGKIYSNLPIYVFYNLANGTVHSINQNPITPPDEVHNVYPGVNGVPYDPSQRYFYPAPNSLYMGGTTNYANLNGQTHPIYGFAGDQICNLLWQFPDPVWNDAAVNWNGGLVFPNQDITNGVSWAAPAGGNGAFGPFTGTPLGGPPTQVLANSSPALVGDSLLLGVSQLTVPASTTGSNQVTQGFMALSADPRSGLQGYTSPESVALYDYSATNLPVAGNFPPGLAAAINNPNNVVKNAVSIASQNNSSLLPPFPPNASFYSSQPFMGQGGMVSTPAVADVGAFVGSGGFGQTGALTFLGQPTTIALDSYRLVGLDAGGNISFEIPSTTKVTLLGADAPDEEQETSATPVNPGQYDTVTEPFNRPSAMQRVDISDVLVADTGNNRVVETDLGGNVVGEVTRYFDPGATYQPSDIYLVQPGLYSVGNVQLSAPVDAYQWSDVSASNGLTILNTYRLIVDSGSSQIVEIQDSQYLTGPNSGSYVPFRTMVGPDGVTQVSVATYHIKVWGTQPSPTGARYNYRNVAPYLVPVNGRVFMPFVFATVSNYGLAPPAAAGQPWQEKLGASIVELYGSTDATGAAYPAGVPGSLYAAATSFQDHVRPDNTGAIHPLQNPVFLRLYQDTRGSHLLYIDQGAFYSPLGLDTRQGNWGVYDLLMPGAPGAFSGDFSAGLSVLGSMDDLDYSTVTALPDIYYAAPPVFQPTSVEYNSMTNSVLISNAALNPLADPTTSPAIPLGPGGEVLLINGPAFYHASAYVPDGSATLPPSILFRSIPVKGSYLLQQVVAADRE